MVRGEQVREAEVREAQLQEADPVVAKALRAIRVGLVPAQAVVLARAARPEKVAALPLVEPSQLLQVRRRRPALLSPDSLRVALKAQP